MDELIAFLRAQLDEDEQVARYSGEPRRWSVGECVSADEPGETEWEITTEDGFVHTRTRGNMRANHIVRHDPARMLAEVDAKRRTLIRCEEEMLSGIPRLVHFCEQTLREMARPYAERPGYQAALKAVSSG
jgi:hypothetical protein